MDLGTGHMDLIRQRSDKIGVELVFAALHGHIRPGIAKHFQKSLDIIPRLFSTLVQTFLEKFRLNLSVPHHSRSMAAENPSASLPSAATPDPNRSYPECRSPCGCSAVPPAAPQMSRPESSRRRPDATAAVGLEVGSIFSVSSSMVGNSVCSVSSKPS